MRRLRVMTFVGTRPELIKLSRVIAELERHTEHLLVHSGQNYDYELNAVFYSEPVARELEADFERDLQDCTEFHREIYEQRGVASRFRDSVARVLSPLL